jgi:hypothetical protein
MSAAGLLVILLLAGAGPMERVVLKLPGRVTAVVPADLDGDRDMDLLVFWNQGFPPATRSRVSVFRSAGGRVDPKPAQVLSLPDETVAYDVGDVDADGRDDVLLLCADGVWALGGRKDKTLSPRRRKVVAVMTVAAFPHEDRIPRISLLVDLGGRLSRRGLLVPTVPIGPLALYEFDRRRGWFLRKVLRVPARMNVHSSAEDFRFARDFGAIFQITFPRWSVADQNGDGLWDLLFFSQDSVAVFRARKDGSFPAEPDLYRGFGLLTPDERVKRGVLVRGEAGDVNGDGRADVFFKKTVGGISNMKTDARLYLALADGDYPQKANSSFSREGHGASARLQDVDGDGRCDLVWPHVEMGLANLIRMMLAGKLSVTFEVFFSDGGVLSKAPRLKIPSSLGINFQSAQELSGPYPVFGEDFNKDGYGDLVLGRAGAGSGDAPDRLEIYPGTPGGRFADDPLWHVDLPGTRFVLPLHVRPDDPPGLLVYFSLAEKRRGDVWVLHNTGAWR